MPLHIEDLFDLAYLDEQIASGYVLTCQSVPKSDSVELDYDA